MSAVPHPVPIDGIPSLPPTLRRAAAAALAPVLGADSAVVDRIGSVLTLYRIVGARELAMLADDGWARLPYRDAWSPIILRFHDRADARRIVAERAERSHAVPLHVVSVRVERGFALSMRVEIEGRVEYWADATQLPQLNDHIVGPIRPAP
jgi:hypothetical protein